MQLSDRISDILVGPMDHRQGWLLGVILGKPYLAEVTTAKEATAMMNYFDGFEETDATL